ncbi:MAG: CDP-glycerol glycerophosphotransferase family protein [Parachlamydiales bacterium]|nr:CDP-glycerol glycerophosphotransferase family protein [Parachlamydiales bacterium]
MQRLKPICLNFTALQLIDHIAPLAYTLNCPLITEDEKNFDLIKQFYPFVDASFQNPLDFYKIANSYDLLFECKFWNMQPIDFAKEVQLINNKNLKLIYCPHGNSDKGFIEKEISQSYITQDSVLLYGDHMINSLKKENVFNKLKSHAVIGNFRLSYYLKFKNFYDDLIEKKIFSKFKSNKKTILYAPTWKDLENSTSFFKIFPKLINKISSKNFNLIVKLHPLLEERNPKEFYKIYSEKSLDNVIYLSDFPLIYPLLNRCDIYLGDFSSVGYDFLYFQKPMFFLDHLNRNHKNSPTHHLFNCGIQIPKDKWDDIFDFIEDKIKNYKNFTDIQKEIYLYTFGKNRSLNEIKKSILKSFS